MISWPKFFSDVYSNNVSTTIGFLLPQLAPHQTGGMFNKNKRIHQALRIQGLICATQYAEKHHLDPRLIIS